MGEEVEARVCHTSTAFLSPQHLMTSFWPNSILPVTMVTYKVQMVTMGT